jgi:hypothetical protein
MGLERTSTHQTTEKGLPLVDNPAAAPRSVPPPDEPGPDATDDNAANADGSGGNETGGSEPGPIGASGNEPTGSEPAASTTSAAPSRPSAEDVGLLAFAQSFELTARDLYETAIAAGAAGDHADVFTTLMENHEEYGNVLAGIIGVDAPQRRDDAIFEQFVVGFDRSETVAVAEAAYEFESTAVATHTELIGQLVGLDGATTLAALLMVESRHCTVLAHIAGRGDDMAALIENTATALPSAPVEG